MFKKFASVLGTFTLICFSFYYTDSAIDVIKKTDPIMQQIIEYSSEYGNTSIDSTLVNNNIIPGIKGTIVDIDESYNKMKRLGKFDTSLIVFQEVNPEISIINNYENYIISGNNQKNNISLIFVLEDSSFILLESNYDPNILKCSSYPYLLKKRIAGPNGHLPNEEAGKTISFLANSGLESVMLGHLSKENNFPELAYKTVVDELIQNNYNENSLKISVAKRDALSIQEIIN